MCLPHRLRLIGIRSEFLVEPVQLLIEHLLKLLEALPVNTPAPRFGLTFSQASSKFFRLYTLSTNE